MTLGGINLFMVFFYNYKYGSAAAKNIQDEIKKNKKTRNFNSLSYFRSLQTY